MTKISVILPTFNEKDNIPALIENIHLCLNNYAHEIIVVDDDSPDGTYQTVLRMNDSRTKPILRKGKRSLAQSIRLGLETAVGDILIVMDSDFNHQPRYLRPLLESMETHDCVVASRFLPGGRMDHPVRHVFSWMFNRYTAFLTRGKVSDNLYGFFAIRRDVLVQYDYEKIFFGFGDYFIRLMYYLQKKRVNIHQIPAVNGRRLSGRGNRQLCKTAWQYFLAVNSLALKECWEARVYRN